MQSKFFLTPVVLLVTGALSAQGAKYDAYGWGCSASGIGPSVCASSNPKGGTNSIQQLTNEYCYGFTAPSTMTVIGVQLFTSTFSTTTPASTKIAFYFGTSKTGTTPKTTFETLGEARVGTKQQFYSGYFAQPIVVQKDTTFWIGQADSNLVHAAGITSGTAPKLSTYWRRPPLGTTAWAVTGIVSFPSVKVLCLAGNQVKNEPPILTSRGVPSLGNKSFAVEVRQSPAGMPLTILLGVSRTKWGGINLPFDMSVMGGPTCNVWASGEFMFGMGAANAQGYGFFPLPVPNTASLNGFKFYNQIYMPDPRSSRALRIAVTNGGEGTIGK